MMYECEMRHPGNVLRPKYRTFSASQCEFSYIGPASTQ
ncbi:hypothetical protein Pan14r_37050 [Crateriforma conspicua]|uniref:Uncharacterized protein n=1 Tax=Crateriforma conspicua TaxID=2527996 RepID=A0A5C5YAP9_9PLAN|nr:hypothetical protein Mal65_51980 [Crateriforma conspicua]TWT71395.1 hypothetical protein Pan14r_37050 [Crateriforma conspicua]